MTTEPRQGYPDHEPYELWVWLVTEDDGTEGAIAAEIPPSNLLMVLQNRKREVAQKMQPFAVQHALENRKAVRLAHLREVPDSSVRP